jgi:hypothetical protein
MTFWRLMPNIPLTIVAIAWFKVLQKLLIIIVTAYI